MKAVVTGGSGFVGSHLVERLVRDGMDVVCLVRVGSDLRYLRPLGVQTRIVALEDGDALRDAVRGADYVFHVAGLTRGRTLAEYLAANAAPTRGILQAVLNSGSPVRRFVLLSSLAAVGPNLGVEPQDESTPPHPHDHYGTSKLAAERIVLAEASHAAVTIVRPPGVYGPRDTNLLPMFRTAWRRHFVPIIGSADKQVSMVHVSDLAAGIALAAAAPAAVGQTYFLASGTYTLGQIADAMSAAMGIPLRRLRVPGLVARLAGEIGQLKWALTGRPQIVSRRKVRDLLQPRWTCTWAKATRDMGYAPAGDVVQGFRETFEWYQREGWL
jgi:nucleoside-diphosphate-sugar epimerase